MSLIPILLPSNSNNDNNNNDINNNDNNKNTTNNMNQSIKCGLIAALESGIFTIWDLSTLIIRPFEGRGVPICIYKICLYEHPAGFLQKLTGTF